MDLPDYNLPPERIARRPAARREDARLLVLGPGPARHERVSALPRLLRSGDLLVVNDTRVMHARLRTRRATGGAVEVLLLEPGPGPVAAMVRPGRRLKAGETLAVEGGGEVRLEAPLDGGGWSVRTHPAPLELMERAGEVPLPPYLEREADEEDAVRYQTVFAREPGAVAAPTAGLHLTEALFEELAGVGIGVARITLHVGPGTFRTLRPEDLERGRLHAERYVVSDASAAAIARARAAGGRVIAVGTTAARTLESAAGDDGVPTPGPGVTDLFIRAGHRFRCVDGLLTNFHLPRTSLLMLVCALGGRERVLTAYQEAIARGYRFYSYGDAMLLL